MSSTLLCENCGIKVPGGEGSECPGCGHINKGSVGEDQQYSGNSSGVQKDGSFFSNTQSEKEWSVKHILECEALFEKKVPYIDQLEIVHQVIKKTQENLVNAPDKESNCRLNAYLSEMYRVTENYSAAFEAGVQGVESSEQYFKFQAHNSILDSLMNLNRHQEFETWMTRAAADNFVDANFFQIRYLTKIEKFDEALELCENYFSSDQLACNSHRSEILVKAKRFDDAEIVLRKLIANGPRSEYAANWINTLAFSILMPQKRYSEAETVLISALCTDNQREKINAFSNLGMLAYKMNEIPAAKRYATIASQHPETAIASEARLTLCRIELKRLQDLDTPAKYEWENFFLQVKTGLEMTDFDDAPAFLELLVTASEKAGFNDKVFSIIEKEFDRLKGLWKWNSNQQGRENLQTLRVNVLSRNLLQENNFLELDQLFTDALRDTPELGFDGLLDYLKTPFAAIDLRRAALKISDKEFLASWASFESHEEILFGLVKNPEEPILVALAENPSAPEAVLTVISKKNDIDLDFALCNRENLSQQMIKILSKSTFEAVRKLVAQREDLDTDTFTQLATDSAMLVRDAIRENQACPQEIRALAALGSL